MSELWGAREDGQKVDGVGGEDLRDEDRRGDDRGDGAEGGGARAGGGTGAVVNAVIGALFIALVAVGVVVFVMVRGGEKSSLDAKAMFGDNGPRSIQDHPYEQLAHDSVGCSKGAEPALAPLLDDSGCRGIVRAVSVDAGHRFVASVAVVKVRDEETADRLKADIDSGKAGTDRVQFLVPPAASGAVYKADPANLTAVVSVDRHVLVIEVARFDGSAFDIKDEQVQTVSRDLLFVPTDHLLAGMLRDM